MVQNPHKNFVWYKIGDKIKKNHYYVLVTPNIHIVMTYCNRYSSANNIRTQMLNGHYLANMSTENFYWTARETVTNYLNNAKEHILCKPKDFAYIVNLNK